GYTFLMGAPGVLSYNKALYREMRFDPDRELEPVSLFARLPNVLVVNPDVPARNVAELVAYARANPNKLTTAPSARAQPRFFPPSCSNRWPAWTSSSCHTARPPCR
ncbi:MAG: tripartite tricarboxylate transporter substrate-binding protein, partial [Xanthobacteraceae bacterium]